MNAINARLGDVTERLVRRSHEKRDLEIERLSARIEKLPKKLPIKSVLAPEKIVKLERGGASAANNCMPPIPKSGKIAMASTIIPIPPIQCVVLRQKRTPLGMISISFNMLAPVVV